MPNITLKNIVKIFPFANARWTLLDRKERKNRREKQMQCVHKTNEGVVAVGNINLTIEEGKFCVLLGPSGCGKSTLLRMIAGLEEITAGEIYFDERLMNYVPARERKIAMIFQNYSLYPHLTVSENIAYPLKTQRMPREEIEEKMRWITKQLELTHLLKKKPRELSGGERQRVAIGRALVRQPDIFLMDEPFSNLDPQLRAQMRGILVQMHQRMNCTFVYVTHDQTEAMLLAQEIVVLQDGVLQQYDTPKKIFQMPNNLFVAGMVGSPSINVINDVQLKRNDNKYVVNIFGLELPLEDWQNKKLEKFAINNMNITVGVRPVHLLISEQGFEAKLDFIEPLGSECNAHFTTNGKQLICVFPKERFTDGTLFKGQTVRLLPQKGKLHLFDSQLEKNLLL